MGYELLLHIKEINYGKIIATGIAILLALSFTYRLVDNSKLMIKLFAPESGDTSIAIGSEQYNLDSVFGFVDQAIGKTTFNDDMFKIIMVSAALIIIYALFMCLYKL